MNKQILRLAVPNIISNLAVPLLSSIDTALVGHMEGLYHLGAVAIGGLIFNFIYWGFGFLRMGTTGLTAQAFGRSDKAESIHILIRALVVSLLLSIVLIASQFIIAKLSFWLINASPEIEYHADIYFKIRIYAAPATLGLYAIHGWFLGMQNARFPLYLTIIANSANIIFNLLFIKVYGMKSDGIALGTVIAQYIGLICGIALFMYSYREDLKEIVKDQLFKLEKLSHFFSINGDIFIRTLALIFTFSFFTAQSAKLGDDILAVNTILMQLWLIFSFGIDGFAFAAESIIGKYVGLGDDLKLRQAIKKIFYWGVGLGFIFTLAYFFSNTTLIGLFTDKQDILLLAMVYFPWTIIAPTINSFCYIWDGIYIGATATKAMRNSMLFATVLIFIPLFFLGMKFFGNHGIWLAMLIFMVSRWFSLHFLANKHIYKTSN